MDAAARSVRVTLESVRARSGRRIAGRGPAPARGRSRPDDDGQPTPIVSAAIQSGCSARLLELLLEHGADPNAAGADGRSPTRLATAAGRPELLELLRRHGADDQATAADEFLSACLQADH